MVRLLENIFQGQIEYGPIHGLPGAKHQVDYLGMDHYFLFGGELPFLGLADNVF